MNNFSITGRLTNDAEIKAVNDSNVINFSIANNDESKKDANGNYEDVVSFFNCVYWSKSGKMVNHLRKGKMVTCSGRLKQERWEKDGQNYNRVTLRCYEVLPHVFENVENGTIGNSENTEPFPINEQSNVEPF